MPSGITAPIANGEMTSGKEFLLRCSRQFGALVHMRDDSLDDEIKLQEVSTGYHDNSIAQAREALHALKNLTLAEAAVAIEQEYQSELKRHKERLDSKAELKNRYIEMMEKIQDWEPPTPEHENLKEFAMRQLNEGIDWDCDTKYEQEPVRMDPQDWIDRQIERYEHDIKWNKEQKEKEIERVKENNEWVLTLVDSLKELQ